MKKLLILLICILGINAFASDNGYNDPLLTVNNKGGFDISIPYAALDLNGNKLGAELLLFSTSNAPTTFNLDLNSSKKLPNIIEFFQDSTVKGAFNNENLFRITIPYLQATDNSGHDYFFKFNLKSDPKNYLKYYLESKSLQQIQAKNSTFTINSNSFQDGSDIPVKYSCSGTNISPEFEWIDAPAGTTSFVLIMDDEDAPCGTGKNACVHWSIFNIPGHINIIHEDMDMSILNEVTQGKNYTGTTGYEGPCPPNTHNYKITIFALNHNMPVIPNGAYYTRSSFRAKYSKYILGEVTYNGRFSPLI